MHQTIQHLHQFAKPLPQHIAIIMDGNGRWAQARGLARRKGHSEGVEALRRTVRNVGELGISSLTVYAFSSENWNRPVEEVQDLMGLLKVFIRRDLADLHKDGVKVRIIGRRDNVPSDILPLLDEAETLTAQNTKMNLTVAFNYGARDEITRSVQTIAQQIQQGLLKADQIDHQTISGFLDTYELPDPELIIRTSGEQRLSNFLLWQAAYSEFVFCDCHWPDFDKDTLIEALIEYQSRDRRFGALSCQLPSEIAG